MLSPVAVSSGLVRIDQILFAGGTLAVVGDILSEGAEQVRHRRRATNRPSCRFGRGQRRIPPKSGRCNRTTCRPFHFPKLGIAYSRRGPETRRSRLCIPAREKQPWGFPLLCRRPSVQLSDSRHQRSANIHGPIGRAGPCRARDIYRRPELQAAEGDAEPRIASHGRATTFLPS